MNTFMSLAEAATRLGFGSGPALRKSFERGKIPAKFLVRIGARVLRVDVAGLEVWLREQQAYPSMGTAAEVPNGQ
jgi:hypothetical protein